MNTITIELCAEDRARIDHLIKAIENSTPHCDKCVKTLADVMKDTTPITASEIDQNATEATTLDTVLPETENATEAKTEAPVPADDDLPFVTREALQRKAIELINAGKRGEVKDIVNDYAEKISGIPEDKLPEVYARLTELEG